MREEMAVRMALLLTILVAMSSSSFINADTDPSHADALRVMYFSLYSPQQLTKWTANGGDPCGESWKGVTCSGSKVTEIQLSGLELSGSMGHNLQNLTSLTNFDMSNNNLESQIPYNLPPNLEWLNFSGCGFSGRIPYSISFMTSLKYLNLGRNQLQGQLNDLFGQLTSLSTLDFSFNAMSGDLPESFSMLSSMKNMYLQNNQFTGSIDVLANLPLDNLNVEHNYFSGWIPSQLKNINLQMDFNRFNSGAAPPPPPGTPASGKARSNILWKLAIGIGAGLFGILTSCVVLYKLRKKSPSSASRTFRRWKPAPDDKVEVFILQYGASIPQRYRYSDIKKMTNSFKDELGKGGYGKVFKGKLDDDRLVAVKVLNESKGSGEEFINEVSSIGKTSHVNIVSLVGFCYEGKERALVYEFMPNGSLEKFINHKISEESSQHLRVEKLYDIAVGIARGLEYLHHGCATRILHFDIKPHNILLDKDFCPKISDFGLAKIHSRNVSIVSMQEEARGTIGYIAPEVFYRNFGGVSHKSDVYSYGMMVLEMVCGKKNINARASHSSEIYFPQWIYKQLELDEDMQLQQGQIPIVKNEIARKMIIVGLWCIQTNPSQRPSIKKVIEMLEGTIEAMQIPPNTFYSSPPRPQVTLSISPDILSLE